MIHSKVVQRLLDNKHHNLIQYKKILEAAYQRIYEQDNPGIICGYGPAYYNDCTRAKDAIAILTDLPIYVLRDSYAIISDQSMGHFVVNIANLFDVKIDTEVERTRFVDFLQKIQDVHDDVFSKDQSDIYEFSRRINLIAKEYKL